MSMPIIVTFGIVILLLIACIVVLVLHIIEFRKYINKYNSIWSKFKNENLEKDIENLIEEIEKLKFVSKEASDVSKSTEGKLVKSFQKTGFIRYDAYEKGQNELSFALTLLNEKNDGVLLNSIYTRNGSNIYAKRIINGSYDGCLSEEEEKSLQMAKNDKTYM